MVIEQKFKAGEEPDPTEYLFISMEMRRQDQSKPYDAKKACWVPDEKEGFVQGEIEGTKGDLVTVKTPSGDVRHNLYYAICMHNLISMFYSRNLLIIFL